MIWKKTVMMHEKISTAEKKSAQARTRTVLLFLIAAAILPELAFAQKVTQHRGPHLEVPLQSIFFSKPKILSQVSASPLIVDPMQCSSDGTSFVEMVPGGDLSNRTLYSVTSEGEVSRFERNIFPGLKNIRLLSYYPAENRVVTLLSAVEKNTSNDVVNLESKAAADEKRAFYLIVQDRKGSLQGQWKLHLRIQPVQVASLDSGKFLILGIEPTNRNPELELVDTDGTFIRTLDIEGVQYDHAQSISETFGKKREDLQAVLSWGRFVPYRDRILLVQGGSLLPVFEIGESGILRSLKLQVPSGMQIESAVASDGRWIIRMKGAEQLHRLSNQEVVYGTPPLLYEIDPNNGNIVRQLLLPPDISANEITCAVRDRFIALHPIFPEDSKDAKDEPKLALFTGNIGK